MINPSLRDIQTHKRRLSGLEVKQVKPEWSWRGRWWEHRFLIFRRTVWDERDHWLWAAAQREAHSGADGQHHGVQIYPPPDQFPIRLQRQWRPQETNGFNLIWTVTTLCATSRCSPMTALSCCASVNRGRGVLSWEPPTAQCLQDEGACRRFPIKPEINKWNHPEWGIKAHGEGNTVLKSPHNLFFRLILTYKQQNTLVCL